MDQTVVMLGSIGGMIAGLFGLLFTLFLIALWIGLIVFAIGGMWKVFVKAGQPGWGSLIPIYNIYLLVTALGRPVWWVVALCIPLVNIYFGIMLVLDLAKAFGKSTGYAVGMILLSGIFIPLLGWGSAQFQWPVAAAPAAA